MTSLSVPADRLLEALSRELAAGLEFEALLETERAELLGGHADRLPELEARKTELARRAADCSGARRQLLAGAGLAPGRSGIERACTAVGGAARALAGRAHRLRAARPRPASSQRTPRQPALAAGGCCAGAAAPGPARSAHLFTGRPVAPGSATLGTRQGLIHPAPIASAGPDREFHRRETLDRARGGIRGRGRDAGATTVSDTRRLRARPSGVSFDSTGRYSP